MRSKSIFIFFLFFFSFFFCCPCRPGGACARRYVPFLMTNNLTEAIISTLWMAPLIQKKPKSLILRSDSSLNMQVCVPVCLCVPLSARANQRGIGNSCVCQWESVCEWHMVDFCLACSVLMCLFCVWMRKPYSTFSQNIIKLRFCLL